MQHSARLLLLAGSLVLVATVASASSSHYGLTISTASTYNVSFNNGVFTATGDHAVLNTTDLESALANGNTEVTTDNGSGGDETGDLLVKAALSWTSTSALTLDAFRSIFVARSISDEGAGGFTLTYNDGGSGGFLVFQARGHVTFANLSSMLSINGVSYVLVNTIKSLADAIAANPSGAYALADNYDASADGTYTAAPIGTTFTGQFVGLGNSISNLTIVTQPTVTTSTGLFAELGVGGLVKDIRLQSADVRVFHTHICPTTQSGALVGWNKGKVASSSSTGKVVSAGHCEDYGGGLIGQNDGEVVESWSAAKVVAEKGYVAELV